MSRIPTKLSEPPLARKTTNNREDEPPSAVRTSAGLHLMDYPTITDLLGKTLANVENRDNEELIFTTTEGKTYKLFHSQDCCESVNIEDIIGDLNDLVGSPLTMAEEVTHTNENPDGAPPKPLS